MARWAVKRGARFLVVVTIRSLLGGSSRTFGELRGKGVTVEAPRCDVTQKSTLRSVMKDISETFPPTKGCI